MYINDPDTDSSSLAPFSVFEVASNMSPPSPPSFVVDVLSQQTDDGSATLAFPTDLDNDVPSTTYSPSVNSTSIGHLTTVANAVDLQLPIGVVVVIVLASACVLLGAVYSYIYFTRNVAGTRPSTSNPNKNRKSVSAAGGPGGSDHHHHGGETGHDDAADSSFRIHVFLFRKHSHQHRATIT